MMLSTLANIILKILIFYWKADSENSYSDDVVYIYIYI